VVASATSLINALRLRGWRDQPVEVDDEMTE
jgi:hypothetical protein